MSPACITYRTRGDMTEHRVLDDEELAEHDKRLDCEGWTSIWCANCGDCICEEDPDCSVRGYPGFDDEGNECPLHGPSSKHADGFD